MPTFSIYRYTFACGSLTLILPLTAFELTSSPLPILHHVSSNHAAIQLARSERERQRSVEAEAQAEEDTSGKTDFPSSDNGALGQWTPSGEDDTNKEIISSSGVAGEREGHAAAQTPEERDEVHQCLENLIKLTCAVAIPTTRDQDTDAMATLSVGFDVTVVESQDLGLHAEAEVEEMKASVPGGPGTDIVQSAGKDIEREVAAAKAVDALKERVWADDGDVTLDSIIVSGRESFGGRDEVENASAAAHGGMGLTGNRCLCRLSDDTDFYKAGFSVATTASSHISSNDQDQLAGQPFDPNATVCQRGGCKRRDSRPQLASKNGRADGGIEGQAGLTEEVVEMVNIGEKKNGVTETMRDNGSVESGADDSRRCTSPDSQEGCTTGETHGSADLQGDDGSAFGGGDCSDRNCLIDCGCHEGTPLSAAVHDCSYPGELVSKRGERSATESLAGVSRQTIEEAGNELNVGGGKNVPAADESVLAGDSSERGAGSNICDDKGEADFCGEGKSGAFSDASSPAEPIATANESPLNRLVEPLARSKADKRHDPDGVDLYGCLDHFMAEESLVAADGNGYDCESCRSRCRPLKVPAGGAPDSEGEGICGDAEEPTKQDARKRLLMLGKPPGVLVCHLKRLQAKKKIIRNVEFPMDLNMAPFFWHDPKVRVENCSRVKLA